MAGAAPGACGGLALGALSLASFEAATGGLASPTVLAALALAGVAGTAGALARRRPAEAAFSRNDEPLGDAVRLAFNANGDVAEARGPVRGLMGLPPELLLGPGFFDRLHVVDRVAFMRALGEMRNGEACRRVELRVRLPLESSPSGESAMSFLLDLERSDDPLRPFAGRLKDNGEVARLKLALERAQAQAAAAEAERGRLLAGLAHELRTPLTAILGFSDLLAAGQASFADRRQAEYLGLIRQSGQHLLAVIDSMAHVATMEAGAAALEPEPFSIAEAIGTCRSMLALAAEAKGVVMETEVSTACGTIRADRRTVQQLLVILLSNAVKFTPWGGKVSVRARRVGSRLHIVVTDTGCGIDAGDLHKLGQPFTQVGDDAVRREGTGLGLALAKELAKRHGGSLTISSTLGEGTAVALNLPAEWRLEGPAAPAPPANGPWSEDGHARKTA